MQQKSHTFAREMEWASPTLADSGSAFEQACTLIDTAQGGLYCLIETIRGMQESDSSGTSVRLDSAASGVLIQLEMALTLLIESKRESNGKGN